MTKMDGRELTRLELQFIENDYIQRPFQRARDDDKVVCPDCYSFDSRINFIDRAGVDQHCLRIHLGKKFVLHKSIRFSQELHSLEMKNFICRLSKFRREADSKLEVFKEYRVNSDCLNIEIVGESKKEAAKLAALVLHHRGVVKSMDEDRYLAGVLEKGNINDFAENFKVWKAT